MNRKMLLSLFVVAIFASLSFGQAIIMKQSNESGIYKKGENIKVTLELNGLDLDSVTVKTRTNFAQETTDKTFAYPGGEIEIFNGSCDNPTALIFQVRIKRDFASLGLVVAPEEFKPGFEPPDDLGAFWDNEKKALRALDMDVISVPVDTVEAGYVCSDIEINCTGPKPVRGYFAKPANAGSKSLPIVLQVHAAGVAGDWCLSKPQNAIEYAKMGNGALSFDLNAHGMLNGQSSEYYQELEKFELKDYSYRGLTSRNENYFKGMYLRLIRTIDFLTSQPEWDGKRILVYGESQGGGQALVAAGLDDRVTAVVATVPAMCDWGGPAVNRIGGWPNPFGTDNDKEKMLATLPYFDAAMLLKGSKATFVTEIGLIDYTCPSMSVYAALNQVAGEKIIYAVPYRGHHLNQRWYRDTWEKTVWQPKIKFIKEYLK